VEGGLIGFCGIYVSAGVLLGAASGYGYGFDSLDVLGQLW
jgi:hypothetical protein